MAMAITTSGSLTIDAVADRADLIIAAPDEALAASAPELADELLAMGEVVLEQWLAAHDRTPRDGEVEGFHLLSLHRQAAKGDPSFNACRETCRELVYHRNLVLHEPGSPEVARRVRLGAMVARHLALFVGGKLENAGLGEFCCSSRSLRQNDAAQGAAGQL
jgi:hypothetical protein